MRFDEWSRRKGRSEKGFNLNTWSNRWIAHKIIRTELSQYRISLSKELGPIDLSLICKAFLISSSWFYILKKRILYWNRFGASNKIKVSISKIKISLKLLNGYGINISCFVKKFWHSVHYRNKMINLMH